jgi:hypothetical protein
VTARIAAHDAGFVPGGASRFNAEVIDADLRRRFARGGVVRGVRSVPLLEYVVPSRFVLGGVTAVGPRLLVVSRMVIVRFERPDGALQTLVWEPRLADSIADTALGARHSGRGPLGLGRRSAPVELHTVAGALARCGLAPEAVDLVAVGDLRGHDVRRLAGSVRPPADEHQPRKALFPTARVLVQARELEAARSPGPLEAPTYVPGGADDLAGGLLELVDGDVELGAGVALVSTPGLTAGHQSLVLNTEAGVWVVSSNGVASDCWQPLLSKIPGIRRGADVERREAVLPAAGVHDPPALYKSLLRERSLADASRADPRWLTILPDRELADRRRQWPALPTFSHGELSLGTL